MSKILDTTDSILNRRRNYEAVDDLDDITSGGKWTNLATGTGAALTTANLLAGIGTLTTGATAANVCARSLTNPIFLPATDQPAFGESRFKFTEASTNYANVFVGFSSLLPAETMQAAGAGPSANFSGFGFFKQSLQTAWSIIGSIGTTQTIVQLSALLAIGKLAQVSGGGAWQVLKVELTNVRATMMDVCFSINGVLVYKLTDFVWTSCAQMSFGTEIKAGTTASEVLSLDYQMVQQQRF